MTWLLPEISRKNPTIGHVARGVLNAESLPMIICGIVMPTDPGCSPRLSIIIGTWNANGTLARCFQSVLDLDGFGKCDTSHRISAN